MIRDKAQVAKAKKDISSGGVKKCIATKPLKLIIPSYFETRDLVTLGDQIQVVGYYALIVDEKYYTVASYCGKVITVPSSIKRIMIEDEEYFEFTYEVGDVLFANYDILSIDFVAMSTYEAVYDRGRVPFYFNTHDVGTLLYTAASIAGANLSVNPMSFEMLAEKIAYDPKNPDRSYRHSLKTQADAINTPPLWINLRSVQNIATNALSALVGAHADDGLLKIINDPSRRPEKLEELVIS